MCWLDHWASYHCMQKCNLGKGGVDALWEHRGGLIRFLEDVMGWEEDGPCIVSAYLSRSSFSVSSFGYLLRNPKSQTVNNTVGEEAERISYEDHQETKTRFAFPTSSFPLSTLKAQPKSWVVAIVGKGGLRGGGPGAVSSGSRPSSSL